MAGGKCSVHPGLAKKASVDGKDYCEKCIGQIEAARKKVDRHVEPKACFVWHVGARDGFKAMPGTGCAHWVAHVKGWKSSKSACHAGYPVRVKDIVKGRRRIDISAVKKGDLWVNVPASHCGLVDSIKPDAKGGPPVIVIEHCSSRGGGVRKSDFAAYFKSEGTFYR